MRRKVARKKQHKINRLRHLMRGNVLVPLLLIVVLFGVLLTSGTLVNKSATDPKEEYGEAEVASGSGKNNLQLKNLTFKAKPTPSTDACNHDMSKKVEDLDACKCVAWLVYCKDEHCTDLDSSRSSIPGTKDSVCAQFDQNGWCKSDQFAKEGEGWYCIGKPVIYLYPQKPTFVSVKVVTSGDIVVSDPHYPTDGWKNVLANPNGFFTYQNKTYRELFYETESQEVKRPSAGIIISKQNLEQGLREFITRLGLSRQDEQQEFLDWWIPRLQAIPTDRIFVSILEREEKNRLDKVEISPTPDTLIDFIAYFAPYSGEAITPLVLPPTPQRTGFTAIEWGGVIGPNPTN